MHLYDICSGALYVAVSQSQPSALIACHPHCTRFHHAAGKRTVAAAVPVGVGSGRTPVGSSAPSAPTPIYGRDGTPDSERRDGSDMQEHIFRLMNAQMRSWSNGASPVECAPFSAGGVATGDGSKSWDAFLAPEVKKSSTSSVRVVRCLCCLYVHALALLLISARAFMCVMLM